MKIMIISEGNLTSVNNMKKNPESILVKVYIMRWCKNHSDKAILLSLWYTSNNSSL